MFFLSYICISNIFLYLTSGKQRHLALFKPCPLQRQGREPDIYTVTLNVIPTALSLWSCKWSLTSRYHKNYLNLDTVNLKCLLQSSVRTL